MRGRAADSPPPSALGLLRLEPERHDVVARAPRPATPDRDHHELPAGLELVTHRRGLAALGQGAPPQLASRLDVVGMKPAVQGRADEYDSARGHDRPAQTGRSPFGWDLRDLLRGNQ